MAFSYSICVEQLQTAACDNRSKRLQFTVVIYRKDILPYYTYCVLESEFSQNTEFREDFASTEKKKTTIFFFQSV